MAIKKGSGDHENSDSNRRMQQNTSNERHNTLQTIQMGSRVIIIIKHNYIYIYIYIYIGPSLSAPTGDLLYQYYVNCYKDMLLEVQDETYTVISCSTCSSCYTHHGIRFLLTSIVLATPTAKSFSSPHPTMFAKALSLAGAHIGQYAGQDEKLPNMTCAAGDAFRQVSHCASLHCMC